MLTRPPDRHRPTARSRQVATVVNAIGHRMLTKYKLLGVFPTDRLFLAGAVCMIFLHQTRRGVV